MAQIVFRFDIKQNTKSKDIKKSLKITFLTWITKFHDFTVSDYKFGDYNLFNRFFTDWHFNVFFSWK